MYDLLKTLHIFGVILWIGPALGAYWMLFLTWERGEPEAILAAEEACEKVLRLEHVAFVVLTLSGVGMLMHTDWALLHTGWMQQKLGLFAVIVMFEMFDSWVSHKVLRGALTSGGALSSPKGVKAQRLRVWLMRLAIPIGACIVAVIWLAVSKQGFVS